jgi:hypothetical protein
MNMVLLNLAKKLLKDVEYLILEVAQIPKSALIEYGSAGFESIILMQTEREAEAALRLDKLCSMAPGIPRGCVQMLSGAFVLLVLLVSEDELESMDEAGFAYTFMEATHSAGMGEALLPASPFSAAQTNKRLFAEAGLKGAQVRHKRSKELKEWALAEAAKFRRSDKGIARKLANSIPSHLADVSIDPVRLIYEALQKEIKSKKRSV